MKTLIHPTTGKQIKFGRNRPQTWHGRKSMAELISGNILPKVTVPQSTNYSGVAAQSLHNIYLNDQLGDCVIAGSFHVRGVTSANSTGKPVMFSTAQVIHDYGKIGGYNPNAPLNPDGSNPTDQGCDENTALAYWHNTGYPDGVKLVNYVAVDATNIAEVRLAMYLFENLYFGVELPDAWVNPFPEKRGWTWDVAGAPDPNNGHCFVGVDLIPNGIKIDSWGMCGYLTEKAVAYYASPAQGGQLFTLLTPDIVNRVSKKSPAGYDIATLTQYLATV